MKIKNRKKFILSNLIIFSILVIVFCISKSTFSNTIINYTETYIEEGDTLWRIAR